MVPLAGDLLTGPTAGLANPHTARVPMPPAMHPIVRAGTEQATTSPRGPRFPRVASCGSPHGPISPRGSPRTASPREASCRSPRSLPTASQRASLPSNWKYSRAQQCTVTGGVHSILAGEQSEIMLDFPMTLPGSLPETGELPWPIVRFTVIKASVASLDTTADILFETEHAMSSAQLRLAHRVGHSKRIQWSLPPLQEAGKYTLAVKLDGEHARGSPFPIICRPAAVDVSKSRFATTEVYGTAGEHLPFEITLRDRFGNITTSEESPKVSISRRRHKQGRNAEERLLVGNTEQAGMGMLAYVDGFSAETRSYTGVATCKMVSNYEVECCIGQEELGHRMLLCISADVPYLPHCELFGDALNLAVQGEPFRLVLRVRDKFGNECVGIGVHWDAQFVLDVSHADENGNKNGGADQDAQNLPFPPSLRVSEGGGGTRHLDGLCHSLGIYTLSLRAKTEIGAVDGELKAQVTVCSTSIDPSLVARGEGLHRAVAGEPAQFTIQPRNCGDDRYHQALDHGLLKGFVQCNESGERHFVEILQAGKRLSLNQGWPTQWAAASQLEVKLLADRGKLPRSLYDDHEWCFTYTSECASTRGWLHLLLQGTTIAGSPFSVTIQPAQVHLCEIVNLETAIVAGAELRADLILRDRFGNEKRSGSEVVDAQAILLQGDARVPLLGEDRAKIAVSSSDGAVQVSPGVWVATSDDIVEPVEVVNIHEGKYKLRRVCIRAGLFMLSVKVGGKDILPKQKQFRVWPGRMCALQSQVRPSGVRADASEPARLEVLLTARDEFGNLCALDEMDDGLRYRSAANNTSIRPARMLEAGHYAFQVATSSPGSVELHVDVCGSGSISGSPVVFAPCTTAASCCRAVGNGWNTVVPTLRKLQFTLIAQDGDGQPSCEPHVSNPGYFRVVLNEGHTDKHTPRDLIGISQGNGRHQFEFELMCSGKYTIDATVAVLGSKAHISGSPLQLLAQAPREFFSERYEMGHLTDDPDYYGLGHMGSTPGPFVSFGTSLGAQGDDRWWFNFSSRSKRMVQTVHDVDLPGGKHSRLQAARRRRAQEEFFLHRPCTSSSARAASARSPRNSPRGVSKERNVAVNKNEEVIPFASRRECKQYTERLDAELAAIDAANEAWRVRANDEQIGAEWLAQLDLRHSC